MRVFLNERPRSLAILSNNCVLSFRGIGSEAKCAVEFVAGSAIDLSNYVELTRREWYGFCGLISVKDLTYLAFISGRKEVGSFVPGQIIYNVVSTEFVCLNSDAYDHMFEIDGATFEDFPDFPCYSLRRLLSAGSFYYSENYDLSVAFQDRGPHLNEQRMLDALDDDHYRNFTWNQFLVSELVEFRSHLGRSETKSFDEGAFLVTMMRGNVQTANTIVDKYEALITIISRYACSRNGSVFGPFGLDNDGNTANFVETDIILYTEPYTYAYTLLRGNTPLFWKLENQLMSTKIESERSIDATKHGFDRHFESLTQHFGSVFVLDASSKKGNQPELSRIYEKLLKSSENFGIQLDYTKLDFSTHSLKHSHNTPFHLRRLLESQVLEIGAFCCANKESVILGKQSGIFLVNNFDSVEKTNVIQSLISKEAINFFLKDVGFSETADLWSKHDLLWEQNNYVLSKIRHSYNATAPKSKTGGLMGAVVTGVGKKYIGTVVSDHSAKQHTVDKLLGRLKSQVLVTLHDPIHDFVTEELAKLSKDFISPKEVSVFAGTFNVNGVLYEGNLNSWLFPQDVFDPEHPYDIVCVAFEEVVELTPNKIVNVDPTTRLHWEKKLRAALSDVGKYVLLWGGQLGGILILLFVKDDEVDKIKLVEGSEKKTGLGGVSANKGAVAVSFAYSETKFCFVASHLAAGLNNVVERHHDYKTISTGLRFSRGKRIKDHDAVIWMGDFNYRIMLPNEEVRERIKEGDYPTLFEYDQLNMQMAAGESFPYFDEMEITFPPTYKFDNGTSTYDSSEKQRIPAWTDRVLSFNSFKRIMKQTSYSSAQDIVFSDHRPVFATFTVTTNLVKEDIKSQLSKQLYEQRKAEIGGENSVITSAYINEKTLTESLPPPSSDRSKWWIEGGKPVKITFPESEADITTHRINPLLIPNPFVGTDEPDFVRL
ncbi:unnamed protein product [Kuraishia capsulata CBS 1993]|uniref:phosphoinositide 5-phosphatase n=1 Tax=Kuraishia capsulata CBS 1993 TaxID=1382522 RepID=W6MIZ4_9ASCO|nr:uncharacterized protein KUCA_T00002446001 [Kuraishia capsulata CBS 1993]CDK26474.1 unnamed protein product [Kuraishia capsulata CBS 1993]